MTCIRLDPVLGKPQELSHVFVMVISLCCVVACNRLFLCLCVIFARNIFMFVLFGALVMVISLCRVIASLLCVSLSSCICYIYIYICIYIHTYVICLFTCMALLFFIIGDAWIEFRANPWSYPMRLLWSLVCVVFLHVIAFYVYVVLFNVILLLLLFLLRICYGH